MKLAPGDDQSTLLRTSRFKRDYYMMLFPPCKPLSITLRCIWILLYEKNTVLLLLLFTYWPAIPPWTSCPPPPWLSYVSWTLTSHTHRQQSSAPVVAVCGGAGCACTENGLMKHVYYLPLLMSPSVLIAGFLQRAAEMWALPTCIWRLKLFQPKGRQIQDFLWVQFLKGLINLQLNLDLSSCIIYELINTCP